MKIGVIDLFCGIGGLSYGFKCEGFEIIAGIDSDASCRYAYETNTGATFIEGDVGKTTAKQVSSLFGQQNTSFRVLIGCAPCTPFSIYAGRYQKNRKHNPQWQLLEEFARLAKATKPDVVSMENVPRVVRHRVFQDFVRGLEQGGYTVSFQTVRADHYGVPQRRTRLVLIASLRGEVRLPAATHLGRPKTVRDAIGSLPKIKAGEVCRSDRLHFCRGLSDRNLARLKATAEGGSWKDWDSSLQLDCHRKEQGKSFRSVYGRMRWDAPSPVITTQCLGIGNGRFGHPEQDRAISVREAALLQTFPKKFRLAPPRANPSKGHTWPDRSAMRCLSD